MHIPQAALALLLLNIPLLSAKPSKRSYDTHDYYVVEHKSELDGASLADAVAALGVELVEPAGELPNHWIARRLKDTRGVHPRSDDLVDPVTQKYRQLKQLAESHVVARSDSTQDARNIVNSIPYIEKQTLRRRSKRAPPPIRPGDDQPPSPTSARGIAARLGIQDPLFPDQWHLVNDESPEHMMNIVPVWEMGFTGKGIISSIIDDGLEYESEDLKDNFDAEDSYDFNDHEPLPTPKNSDDHHGTRCAGQIAASKNNACGVGIAYDSKVAGVRILSGPITDVDEAAALNYGFQNVSIYSCSWGPPDNGVSMEGPSYIIKKAVVNGINKGRAGKGSIFVFASGNGAAQGDQCNFDGYTNSIYSVTVSAVDHKGQHPYYSEACAANMIVAYSSGDGKHIVTTDKGKNHCTHSHGGTSAAAPNAAGVLALALQARPDLTWRDVQHLCVETAKRINPDDADWEKTVGERYYSYKYGFGALDAEQYVKAAQTWKLVKPQAWFNTPTVQLSNGTVDTNGTYAGGTPIGPGGVNSTITITKEMALERNFEKLEHINVKVWINHTRRGDVEVEVVSPNGVKSVLAKRRRSDSSDGGFPGWTFMSVKHWGENPVGNWTIRVSDQQKEDQRGLFLGWNMIFWGSTIDPNRAVQFDLQPEDEYLLPPKEVPPPVLPPTSTATTTQLTSSATPTQTSGSEGSASVTSTSVAATGTSIPTADEGWFPDMSKLVTNQKWFFAALGAVAIFGLAIGAYLWKRRMSRISGNSAYSALAGEEVSMTARGGGGGLTGTRTTRELYDAFGELSDDEDEFGDENTALNRHGAREVGAAGLGRSNLGFHSGFLEDDEQSAPITPPARLYRDDPVSPEPVRRTDSSAEEVSSDEGSSSRQPSSPNGSSSLGESWEHASRS